MNEVVKNEFAKFGFSQSVLETISQMIINDAGADATDDVIKEKLKIYEPLAKSFQSEIDARVSKAKKTTSTEGEQTGQASAPNVTETGGDETTKLLKTLLEKVSVLENQKVVSAKNELANSRLKDLKMSDAEIKAVMYGREFKTDEEVEDFVTQQSEFFKEVLSSRVEDTLGNGTAPNRSNGASDLESFKKDVETFNKLK